MRVVIDAEPLFSDNIRSACLSAFIPLSTFYAPWFPFYIVLFLSGKVGVIRKLEGFYDLYCEEVLKNERLMAENRRLKTLNLSLSRRITYLETHQEEIIEKQVKKQLSQVTNQFEKEVLHLQNQVEQLKSVLNQIALTQAFQYRKQRSITRNGFRISEKKPESSRVDRASSKIQTGSLFG